LLLLLLPLLLLLLLLLRMGSASAPPPIASFLAPSRRCCCGVSSELFFGVFVVLPTFDEAEEEEGEGEGASLAKDAAPSTSPPPLPLPTPPRVPRGAIATNSMPPIARCVASATPSTASNATHSHHLRPVDGAGAIGSTPYMITCRPPPRVNSVLLVRTPDAPPHGHDAVLKAHREALRWLNR
jgi:hypothetical protein